MQFINPIYNKTNLYRINKLIINKKDLIRFKLYRLQNTLINIQLKQIYHKEVQHQLVKLLSLINKSNYNQEIIHLQIKGLIHNR